MKTKLTIRKEGKTKEWETFERETYCAASKRANMNLNIVSALWSPNLYLANKNMPYNL